MAEFQGLEEARLQFNNWHGKATIFVDFDDNEVFCEVGVNVPHSFSKESVITICKKGDMSNPNMKFSAERLTALINAKHKMYSSGEYENWQINDDYLFGEYLR
jgi:hypothetical protein